MEHTSTRISRDNFIGPHPDGLLPIEHTFPSSEVPGISTSILGTLGIKYTPQVLNFLYGSQILEAGASENGTPKHWKR